jgi:hypothetical protein
MRSRFGHHVDVFEPQVRMSRDELGHEALAEVVVEQNDARLVSPVAGGQHGLGERAEVDILAHDDQWDLIKESGARAHNARAGKWKEIQI